MCFETCTAWLNFITFRICHLLETWMHNYPQDFAVPGAAGALNAIVNSLVNKTYLLHYGCDFKPFLEYISNLVDTDATWAQKTEPLLDESEDPYLFSDGEDLSFVATTVGSASASRSSVAPSNENAVSSSSRERKQSLPLSAKALIMPTSAQMADVPEVPPKQLLKELSKQAQELQTYDCAEIAEEITRNEAVLFMEIQVRFYPLSLLVFKGSCPAKALATLCFCSWSEGPRIRYHCEVQCHV